MTRVLLLLLLLLLSTELALNFCCFYPPFVTAPLAPAAALWALHTCKSKSKVRY